MNHVRSVSQKTAILIIGVILGSCACLHQQAEGMFCVSVYDGDTLELENGEVVRLIGIDSPEHSDPGGDIARDYLSALVLNRRVILVPGTEEQDDYGRLLRYVYVNGVCINEEMIRKGYAEVRYIEQDDANWQYYVFLELEAEREETGLWGCKVFQPRSKVRWDGDVLVIDWRDADQHYGHNVIIEGTIVNTYNSGRVCFINFGADQYFTAVIFGCDFPNFPEPPESYYLGKKVQIAGIIKSYKGRPEIIVKTPNQIRILE